MDLLDEKNPFDEATLGWLVFSTPNDCMLGLNDHTHTEICLQRLSDYTLRRQHNIFSPADTVKSPYFLEKNLSLNFG